MSQNEDELRENLRAYEKQIFQLVNYGHYSEQYVCSMEVSARVFAFELVQEKLKQEKDQQEKEARQIKSQTSRYRTPKKPSR